MEANVTVAIIACGASVVTCAIATALVIWKDGRRDGRWEAAMKEIEKLSKQLSLIGEIPVLQTRLGTIENVASKMQSDHRELARELRELTRTVDRQSFSEIEGE